VKVVRVQWTDAAHIAPGEWVDVVGDTTAKVTTVGFLVRETATHVVVAHSKMDGMWTGVFSIPKSGIRSMRRM
jgi:hypothetical protein